MHVIPHELYDVAALIEGGAVIILILRSQMRSAVRMIMSRDEDGLLSSPDDDACNGATRRDGNFEGEFWTGKISMREGIFPRLSFIFTDLPIIYHPR